MAKLKHAPVFFTVVQVNFNAVTSIAHHIPMIQEQMRQAGYPDFRELNQTVFSMPLGNQGVAPPSAIQRARYLFSNQEGSLGFILDPHSLILQATDYDQFEVFANTFFTGLSIVNENIPSGLAYTERLGLRYLDAVFPAAADSLDRYLVSGMMGLRGSLDGAFSHFFSESVFAREGNSVAARSIILNGSISFPPDLTPTENMRIIDRFSTYTGEHAILDTDASFSERQSFSIEGLRARLIKLKHCASDVFKATTTPYAREKWNE